MRRPAILALAAMAALALVAAGPRPLTVPAGLALALVLPGAALVDALFTGRQLSTRDRLMLAPGLSLAVLVLGALGCFAVGVPLHRTAWAALTGGVTLLAALAGYLRHRAAPPVLRTPLPRATLTGMTPRIRRSTVDAGRRRVALVGALLALSAMLLGGAAVLAVRSAQRADSAAAVVALSALATGGSDATGHYPVSVAVTGAGRQEAAYQVRVSGPNGFSQVLGVRVGPGQTWKYTVLLPTGGPTTMDLYRAGDTQPYRSVFLSGPASGPGGR